MAEMPKNYLIERSSMFIMLQICAIIVACDLLFLLFTFLSIGLHNVLGLDTELTLYILTSFVIKLAIMLIAVLVALKKWLSLTYFVQGEQLVVRKDNITQAADYYDLNYTRQVSIEQSALTKSFGFGNVVIMLSSPDYKQKVVLSNIKNPARYAALLSGHEKTAAEG